MSARTDCKTAGLYGLTELAKLTGRSRPTLYKWYKNDYKFFSSVLIGAVIIKLYGVEDIKGISKKINVLKSLFELSGG